MANNNVPAGSRINYEDDIVAVYNEKGELVEKGLFDYSCYKEEHAKWDEKAGNYILPHGYRMVCLS